MPEPVQSSLRAVAMTKHIIPETPDRLIDRIHAIAKHHPRLTHALEDLVETLIEYDKPIDENDALVCLRFLAAHPGLSEDLLRFIELAHEQGLGLPPKADDDWAEDPTIPR